MSLTVKWLPCVLCLIQHVLTSPSGPQASWYDRRREAASSSSAQEEGSQNSPSVTPGECWSRVLNRPRRVIAGPPHSLHFRPQVALLCWCFCFTGDEDFTTRSSFFPTRFQTIISLIQSNYIQCGGENCTLYKIHCQTLMYQSRRD